jgi:hypothetical protein
MWQPSCAKGQRLPFAVSGPLSNGRRNARSRMDQSKCRARLKESIGQSVRVAFGGNTEIVTVISVDLDGFICRILSTDPTGNSTEFWVACDDVTSITEP